MSITNLDGRCTAVFLVVLLPLVICARAASAEGPGSALTFPPAQLTNGPFTAELTFQPAPGFKLNDEGPFSVEIVSNEPNIAAFRAPPKVLRSSSFPLTLSGHARMLGSTAVVFDIKAYFCTMDQQHCFFRRITATLPVIVKKGGDRLVRLTVPLGR